jgi:hypothetical protein
MFKKFQFANLLLEKNSLKKYLLKKQSPAAKEVKDATPRLLTP